MNTGPKFGLDPKVLNGMSIRSASYNVPITNALSPPDVINVSSGQCWNSLHMNPVAGVQPNSSASKGFKPGFTVELAQGVTRQMTKLMESVGAKSVFGPSKYPNRSSGISACDTSETLAVGGRHLLTSLRRC